MIDARKTFRKVNQTISDFSPEQLEGLTAIIKNFRGEKVDFTANEWLKEKFENSKYDDIEGLCKIASIDEIIENDYSLNPARYVGFTIYVDEDFDYKDRINKINEELALLNNEHNILINIIQG